MADKKKYQPRKHINRVLEATKASYSVYSVLQALCHAAEFDRPEVTITRTQLEKAARRSRNTVLDALRFLKAEGTIVPIKNPEGGRGNAVTYKLQVIGHEAQAPAQEPDEAAQAVASVWDRIAHRLEEQDARTFNIWLSKLSFGAVEGGELRMIAPTGYIAEKCRVDHADRVLRVANQLEPEISRVRFEVAA